jgi:hypothetical protein
MLFFHSNKLHLLLLSVRQILRAEYLTSHNVNSPQSQSNAHSIVGKGQTWMRVMYGESSWDGKGKRKRKREHKPPF